MSQGTSQLQTELALRPCFLESQFKLDNLIISRNAYLCFLGDSEYPQNMNSAEIEV